MSNPKKSLTTGILFINALFTSLAFCASAKTGMLPKTPSCEELCTQHIKRISQRVGCSEDTVTESARTLGYKERTWALPGFSCQYHILPNLVKQYNLKKGCEVGVLFGTQSLCILQGSNIEHLYCVDPFRAYHQKNGTYMVGGLNQTNFDVLHELVKLRLKPYRSRVTLIREPSPRATTHIKDGELDFVYIDGNHDKEPVAADL